MQNLREQSYLMIQVGTGRKFFFSYHQANIDLLKLFSQTKCILLGL